MSDRDVKKFNRNLMKALIDDSDKLRAEVERLKAALREIADNGLDHDTAIVARAALEGK